jgi:hypothetical protein
MELLKITYFDEREISVSLNGFPNCVTPPLKNGRIGVSSTKGIGIHWPGLDEDLSLEGLLA